MKLILLKSVLITVFCICSASPGKARLKLLNDGSYIPALALAPFGMVRQVINWAVEAGYRHFDISALSDEEAEVGQGIADVINKGLVTREELFITTRLWNDAHGYKQVVPAIRQTLRRLGLDYVDLYLIHTPVPSRDGSSLDSDYLDAWESMVDAKSHGYVKSIGLAAFNSEQIEKIVSKSGVVPAVNKIEIHPSKTEDSLVKDCFIRGINIMANSPLGYFVAREGSSKLDANDPKLLKIANKYGKSVVQIIFRYLIDRDLIPIPNSSKKRHIEENIDVFDFQLTTDEVKAISSFNTNTRLKV